tara:strand:- start:201 stop:887 length:687 start_codon:yes stop_codon:yes gene_type:complete
MSTFLQLCQKVASESGTISGTLPTAVTGQSGRLLQIVNFTIDAWRQVQNSRNNWNWMRKEFSGSLTSGTAKYTGASFSISDFARWVSETDSLTLYLTATGVSDEGEITFISWSDWRKSFGRGSQTNNRPTNVSITPANELAFGSIPNDSYTVNGEYHTTAEVLVANADVPSLPERYHDIIAYKALVLLGEFDEAPTAIATAQRKYNDMLSDLERDQLPVVVVGTDPLA